MGKRVIIKRMSMIREGRFKRQLLWMATGCLSILVLFLLASSIFAFNLPDTGQTKCYRGVSPYDEIPCAGTMQDGDYNINLMSFNDNGNDTVTDNNTGLIWQKRDYNGYYANWYKASGTYDATYNPSSQNICGNLVLGGQSDWRLPSKLELMSLVNYGVPIYGLKINTAYFPNAEPWGYYTATTFAGNPDEAWGVSFNNGGVGVSNKSSKNFIRCVRGTQLDFGNFTDNNDGTVTNNGNGLMWQQGEPDRMTWDQAITYCEGLSLGGRSDWRLPNFKELESITDDYRVYPAINTTYFPNAHGDVSFISAYWSSTTYFLTTDSAYVVDFYDGGFYGGGKWGNPYVRCVRGGQSIDSDGDGYLSDVDCNDNDPLVNPSVTEGPVSNANCSDGIDNDCDKKTDLADPDCISYNLTVSMTGNLGGTVTSSPKGISCMSDCYEKFAQAMKVTLTATADKNSTFVQWTGACSGTNSKCTVNVDSTKNATAEFKPKSYDLKVTLAGNGTGKVSSDRVGIECGNGSKLCSAKYEYNTTLVLTATPIPDDKHSAFEKWTGDCNSCKNSLTCSVTVSKAMNCTVNFKAFELKASPGVCTGAIVSDISGIDCGTDCKEKYAPNTVVKLSYTEDPVHSVFKEWKGCDKGMPTSIESCQVTMKAAANVSAVCTAYDLKVTKTGAGAGGGIVRSEPSGIDCGQDCTEKYAPGQEVTLTAFDTMYGKFNGWTAECTTEGKNPKTSVCTVNMDKAKTVTASFAAVDYKVKVTGSGKVTSNISGIDCGKDCSEKYAPGQVVVLTAVSLPDAMHSKFVKWKGVCGEGENWTGSTCTVTPSDAKGAKNSIEAEFVSMELKVKVTGSGKVTSNISGIDCGKDCSEKYALDRQVTLTAEPLTGYDFAGWSLQECPGTGACVVTMDKVKSVTANFTKVIPTLYNSSYKGTFSGSDTGTWSVYVDSSGNIDGEGWSNYFGDTFEVTGTVSRSGVMSFTASGGTGTGATFTGQVSFEGKASGKWVNNSYGNEKGTFSGSRVK